MCPCPTRYSQQKASKCHYSLSLLSRDNLLMEQVTRAEGAFRCHQVNNWNGTSWQETDFNLWHERHRMEIVTGFTESRRTDTRDKTNGFSRKYRAKDQRSPGWGHQGRGVCSWWVQRSPTPDSGQGPRVKTSLLRWGYGLNLLPHLRSRTHCTLSAAFFN